MFNRFWQISLVLAATVVAGQAQTPPPGAAQSTPPQAPKTHLKRTVVKDYGVLNEATGYATRATFVIDKEGVIRSIEEGRTAIDPSGAYQACSVFEKKTSSP